MAKRKTYDFAAAEAARPGDQDIDDVGQETRMPWEIDGPRWHTVARVGRTRRALPLGRPHPGRRGRAPASLRAGEGRDPSLQPDRLELPRSVVEIRAAKKSDGWFFHAITGEEWLLKMKFRTARNTFQRDELVERLDLKPLNDMPDLPLYGTEPRVRCRNLRGPWQEIELRVHSYEEIDRPEFWKFVDQAVAGFEKFSQRVEHHADVLAALEAARPQVAPQPPRLPAGRRGRVGRAKCWRS